MFQLTITPARPLIVRTLGIMLIKNRLVIFYYLLNELVFFFFCILLSTLESFRVNIKLSIFYKAINLLRTFQTADLAAAFHETETDACVSLFELQKYQKFHIFGICKRPL